MEFIIKRLPYCTVESLFVRVGCLYSRLASFFSDPPKIFFKTTFLPIWICILFGSNAWAEEYPQRIVSLSPSITETLFAIDAGDRVVGVTDFCDYPKEALSIQKVGGLINPNFETLVSLQPDLVILQHDRDRLQGHLGRLGLKVLAVRLEKLKDILDSILIMGNALGKEAPARDLNNELTRKIFKYRSLTKNAPRKSVFLLLGDSQAPTRDLYAVGKGTFLDELLEIAGGNNIVDSTFVEYPRLSKEFIIRSSPEIIIEANPNANISTEQRLQRRKFWNQFPSITAVKKNKVHYVGEEFILIPGPRFPKIVEQFVKVIHPGLFNTDSGIRTLTQVGSGKQP